MKLLHMCFTEKFCEASFTVVFAIYSDNCFM